MSNSYATPEYEEETLTFAQVNLLPSDTILEFGVPWCQHCQAAHFAIEEALNQYSPLPLLKIYDGKGKPLGRAFKVKYWPTLIYLHKGIEVARLVRPLHVNEVTQFISQHKR